MARISLFSLETISVLHFFLYIQYIHTYTVRAGDEIGMGAKGRNGAPPWLLLNFAGAVRFIYHPCITLNRSLAVLTERVNLFS